MKKRKPGNSNIKIGKKKDRKEKRGEKGRKERKKDKEIL